MCVLDVATVVHGLFAVKLVVLLKGELIFLRYSISDIYVH